MIDRPVRHAMYQRAREIERIGAVAPSVRASTYMDEHVRRVSDTVAGVAALTSLSADLQKSLLKKQGHMSLFRQAMGHFAETSSSEFFRDAAKTTCDVTSEDREMRWCTERQRP